ncbi:hypothetical protein BJY04DRAFT_199269 [Aspergillus karnatakaensis]|uniref:Zn(II)2Cys6 transcription factor domain-containing protein n=1 Tax=Aspergillus karnatakaensis TaxID=1810916 RepID=UPI003CCC9AE3
MAERIPYGLACLNCYKVKSKCVRVANGQPCERCIRLKKECQTPSDPRRRRTLQKTASARIAELEARLDEVYAILQGTRQSPSDAVTLPPMPDQRDQPYPSNPGLMAISQDPGSLVQPAPPVMVVRDPGLALMVFRDMLLPHCPFIQLPMELSAAQLERERPFLYQAILAVSEMSMEQKAIKGQAIKVAFAQAAIVENGAGIDILLGLLVYVAWGYDHVLSGRPTLSRLLELALSIIYDLRLNEAAPIDLHTLSLASGSEELTEAEQPTRCTLEEQRAVLGCFILCSYVAIYFGHMDPMRWTSRMEEYLRFIEANDDCPSDITLASYVRIQLLIHNAAQTRLAQPTQLPVRFFLSSFRPQLDKLRQSLPCRSQYQELIHAHLHYAALSIHETAFTAKNNVINEHDLNSPATTLERIECLQSSLQAIKSWFGVFLGLPDGLRVGTAITLWAQFSRNLVTLYRLSVHPDPAWDSAAVPQTIDIIDCIEKMIDDLDNTAKRLAVSFPTTEPAWASGIQVLQGVLTWLRTNLGKSETPSSDSNPPKSETSTRDWSVPASAPSSASAPVLDGTQYWDPNLPFSHPGDEVTAAWLEDLVWGGQNPNPGI